MRIWAAIVVLTSSWLISKAIASEPINATLALPDNGTVSSGSISQASNTKPITVSKAEFGVLRIDSNGEGKFTPTTRVLLNQGGKYGWRIQLKDYKGKVTWREVLRLPKTPQTWATDDGENFSLSPDGLEAVTKRTESTSDGVIENFWTIAPGDPGGKHRIQVYIDKRLIANFEFEVISLKKQ
ncbi:hypothetical protein I8748_32490 [Nostoc sp. CENA67]|uniref:Proteinase inhibitor I42 chagasin domain-containing protein n=1 Tax=Amazonocrinis nigriterrae CENA67 TaxID=2794033 RepID=A0A8J7I297_9NOST|nr:hypothetical protein [Amazonocrinis nigriterrae]MBH8566814.1 hypothetical protein [Amazonocrinis nigriterrae CENA67]